MKTETKKRNVFRRVKRLTFSGAVMVVLLFAANANAQSHDNSSKAALDAIDVVSEEYTFMNGFPGEFSIGYAF